MKWFIEDLSRLDSRDAAAAVSLCLALACAVVWFALACGA